MLIIFSFLQKWLEYVFLWKWSRHLMLVPNKWLPRAGLLFKIQFHSSHLYIVPPPQTQPKMCSRNNILSLQVITYRDNIFLKLIKIKNPKQPSNTSRAGETPNCMIQFIWMFNGRLFLVEFIFLGVISVWLRVFVESVVVPVPEIPAKLWGVSRNSAPSRFVGT